MKGDIELEIESVEYRPEDNEFEITSGDFSFVSPADGTTTALKLIAAGSQRLEALAERAGVEQQSLVDAVEAEAGVDESDEPDDDTDGEGAIDVVPEDSPISRIEVDPDGVRRLVQTFDVAESGTRCPVFAQGNGTGRPSIAMSLAIPLMRTVRDHEPVASNTIPGATEETVSTISSRLGDLYKMDFLERSESTFGRGYQYTISEKGRRALRVYRGAIGA